MVRFYTHAIAQWAVDLREGRVCARQCQDQHHDPASGRSSRLAHRARAATGTCGKAPGGFPVYLAQARGAWVTDLDGHRYVDLCLGDTAAMAGHSPEPLVRAVQQRYDQAGGASAMLPTE